MSGVEPFLRQIEELVVERQGYDWRGTMAVLADYLEERGHPFALPLRELATALNGRLMRTGRDWYTTLGRGYSEDDYHILATGRSLPACLSAFARQYCHTKRFVEMTGIGVYIGSPAWYEIESTQLIGESNLIPRPPAE